MPFLLVFFLFLTLLPFVNAEEPKFRCKISAPPAGASSDNNWKPVDREATPREAGRQAVAEWEAVKSLSNNKNINPAWIDAFDNCLKASGLVLSEVVESPERFRHLMLRSLRDNADSLNRDRKLGADLDSALKAFYARKAIAVALAPGIESTEMFRQLNIDDDKHARAVAMASAATERARDKCQGRDLSSRLGPVRDQTDLGWCYAFAASDLATFYRRRKEGPKAPAISAADLAFRFNHLFYRRKILQQGLDASRQEGGWEGRALKAALDSGFCAETDAPSEDFAFGSLKETVAGIEKLKLQALAGEGPADQCFAFRRTLELFPGIDWEAFQEILEAVGERNIEFFEKLGNRNCQNKRFSLGITKENIREEAVEEDGEEAAAYKALMRVDGQLDENNISSVGVAMRMLVKGGEGAHALVVVGRKFDEKTQSCKYLLRNSWGPGCSSSLRPGLCAPEHSGHIWVDRKDLLRDMNSVTYIE